MSLHAHKCNKSVIIKAGTGASRHYFKVEDKHISRNIKKTDNPPEMQLPDNTTVTAVEQGALFLHKKLTPQAQSTQIIPAITNSSLLSIGQLCDDNCTAVFNKRDVKIYKDNDIIVKGQRSLHDGLWDINLPPFTHH